MVIRLQLAFLFLIWMSPVAMSQDLSDLESRVKRFNLNTGLAAQLESPFVAEYIDLTDDQVKKIRDIKKEMKEHANAIATDESTDLNARLRDLNDILSLQSRELNKVLLPHQSDRIGGLADYLLVIQNGFSRSVIDGFIAQRLDLSVAERRVLRSAGEEALEEYREAMIKAQKAAIAKFQKAMPESKRAEFDAILKPMFFQDGTLWKLQTHMLEISGRAPLGSSFRLPSIDEED